MTGGEERRGLTEAETELVTRLDVVFVKVPVVDVETFGITVVSSDWAEAVITD